jgi:hypothetical protein
VGWLRNDLARQVLSMICEWMLENTWPQELGVISPGGSFSFLKINKF